MAETNGNNQYEVIPPGGKKTVGYTRVSNIAKLPEDGNSLINWRVRQTMIGLVRRPDLCSLVATHPDEPSQLDKVAEKALEAAESDAGANNGTALHAALHRWSQDDELPWLPDRLAMDLGAVRRCFEQQGIEIQREWCEHMVVLDEHRVAGTFDLLLRMPNGDLVLADYKTTKRASIRFAWGGYSCQLALYRHGIPYDQSTHTRKEWPPELREDYAVVVHVPVGEAVCELHRIDLGVGWEGAKLGLAVRAWRKTLGGVAVPVEHDMTPELEQSVEMVLASRTVAPDIVAPDSDEEAARKAAAMIAGSSDPETVAWLLETPTAPAPEPVAAPEPEEPFATTHETHTARLAARSTRTVTGLIDDSDVAPVPSTVEVIEAAFPGAERVEWDRAKDGPNYDAWRKQALRQQIVFLKERTPPEILEHLMLVWPKGVPGFATQHDHTSEELDLIAKAVASAEDRAGVPFP